MSLMKRVLKLMFFILLVSCSTNNNYWEYDMNYTMDLIFNTSGYYSEGVPNSVASVDVVQIYSLKEKKDQVLPLKVLRRQQLISELRKKEDIASFFESFQKIVDHQIEGCSISKADYVFHIVVFDSKLMRVAYFRYYLCSVKGIKYGMIRPLGGEGIFYNIVPPVSSLFPPTTPRQ